MANTFAVNVYAMNGVVLPTVRSKGFPASQCIFDTVPTAQALVAGVYGQIMIREKSGWNVYQVVQTVAQLVTAAG